MGQSPTAYTCRRPTADGPSQTQCAKPTCLVNTARHLAGEPALAPKGDARFHFELPGSVQGFQVEHAPEHAHVALENTPGHSRSGQRSLRIAAVTEPGATVRVATATFIPPDAIAMPGYGLLASPTIYAGQLVEAALQADPTNTQPIGVQLYLNIYGPDDQPRRIEGPAVCLQPGEWATLQWRVPRTDRLPIFAIGLELDAGTIFLDSLTWSGEPDVAFGQPASTKSLLWRKAWVNGVDHWEWWSGEPFRLVKNEGRGMASIGTREWHDYRFSAVVRPAFLAEAGGIAVNVQGMQRFYALQVRRGGVQLVKVLDGTQVLGEKPLAFELWQEIGLSLQATVERAATGGEAVRLIARLDGETIFDLVDDQRPMLSGGAAFVVDEAHILAEHVTVQPASTASIEI